MESLGFFQKTSHSLMCMRAFLTISPGMIVKVVIHASGWGVNCCEVSQHTNAPSLLKYGLLEPPVHQTHCENSSELVGNTLQWSPYPHTFLRALAPITFTVSSTLQPDRLTLLACHSDTIWCAFAFIFLAQSRLFGLPEVAPFPHLHWNSQHIPLM